MIDTKLKWPYEECEPYLLKCLMWPRIVLWTLVNSHCSERPPPPPPPPPPKLCITGHCVGNSPGTGEFPQKWPVTRKLFPFDDVIMGRGLPKQWWVTTCRSVFPNNHGSLWLEGFSEQWGSTGGTGGPTKQGWLIVFERRPLSNNEASGFQGGGVQLPKRLVCFSNKHESVVVWGGFQATLGHCSCEYREPF